MRASPSTVALALALGLAAERCSARAAAPVPRGRPAVWAADRAGHRLVALDRDLFPVRSIVLQSPTAIEPDQDGGLWAVSAGQGTPLGPHRLLRLDAEGVPLLDLPFGPIVDLAWAAAGVALVEQGGGPARTDRALLVGRSGVVSVVIEAEALGAVAYRDGLLAIGSRHGDVWLVEARAHGTFFAHRHLGDEVRQLEPGPRAGTFWAIEGGEPNRLHLLGPDLAPIDGTGPRELGAADARVAAAPGTPGAWLVESGAGPVRSLRAPPGTPGRHLPLGGVEGGLPWRDGGVLLCAPGAILRLDAAGRFAPGQGGFRHLVDLAEALSAPR